MINDLLFPTLVGSDITVNATVIREYEDAVIAVTKSDIELVISKNDINTVRPKVVASKEDKRKGN